MAGVVLALFALTFLGQPLLAVRGADRLAGRGHSEQGGPTPG
jgi:hypothetical protein